MIAGLVDALHYAKRADAVAVLGALGDTELAAGIAGAELPLCVAVSDCVVERSEGTASLLALARRALVDETVADPDAVLRALLRLVDPAVDELFFRDDNALRSRAWLLRAVVRERRDANGRPVIAPAVERFLRKQVFGIERRLAGWDRPRPARIERLLLDAALWADDAGLVMFALPVGIRLRSLSGVARGVQTLRDFGMLDDLWTDGLRESIAESIAEAADDKPNHWYSQWQELLKFGDADSGTKPALAPRLFRSAGLLPSPDDTERWTTPGTASQHYALNWDEVLAVVGNSAQPTSRGLDEAAAREDVPEDVRAELEASYPRTVFWTARPTIATLICAALDELDLNPATRHFGMRELLRRGLLHGSLSAADAVEYAAPAADVLALAVPTPVGLAEYYTAKGKNGFAPHNARIPVQAEERYQADLRAAVVDAIGPDPDRWLKILTRVAAWEDSLTALLSAIDDGESLPTRRGHRWPRGADPAAVLLEIAPEGVVDRLLAAAAQADGNSERAAEPGGIPADRPVGPTGFDPGPNGIATDRPVSAAHRRIDPESRALLGVLTRILDRGPIPRRLLDHALGPQGTAAMRLAAARNPAATGGTLWRLADREPAEPRVLAAVYQHPLASRELRVAAMMRAEAAGGLYPGLVRRLMRRDAEPALLLPALESRTPEVLHTVLRQSGQAIATDRRIAAYARLAAAAGPEPVWALELERVGSLEHMHEAVSASMAAHSDAPLREAAAGTESPAPERVTRVWDAGFEHARPDTADRVRARLDGRPERWLRLLDTDPDLHGLLAKLEDGAKEGDAV